MYKSFCIVFLLFFCSYISSQEYIYDKEGYHVDHEIEYYFKNHLYGAVSNENLRRENFVLTPSEVYFERLDDESHLLAKMGSLRVGVPRAEEDLQDFIDDHDPDPIIKDAVLELGSHYYNLKRYNESIETYDRINESLLSEIELSEKCFKKAYCHFVNKEFDYAILELEKVKDIRNIYYYPANYYCGMSQYFKEDYDSAITSFQRISGSTAYKPHLPYYITQIFFVKGQFNELIEYGQTIIDQPNLKKETEIRLLLGQAHFQRKEYEKALPYLMYYEEHSNALTAEEFFQIGFCQYVTGSYEEAIENFTEISSIDSQLGQMSNYYLADCLQKTGNLASARAAFKNVSQKEYNKAMQAEAIFNYGKISAQLGFDRESINVLTSISSGAPYFEESQSIINDVLSSSSDFEYVLKTLNSIPDLTDMMKATYQNASLKLALLAISDGKNDLAQKYLKTSNIHTPNKRNHLQSLYWEAYLLQKNKSFEESTLILKEYFKQHNGEVLPFESDMAMARYMQAHNFIKLEDFASAEYQYKQCINGLAIDSRNELAEKFLSDAFLRAADCQFKQRAYVDAKANYTEAIKRNHAEKDYATYQKATIEGLLNEPYLKISILEGLRDDFPNSEYNDDALLALGDTYMSMGNIEPAKLNYVSLISKYLGKSVLVNRAYMKMGLLNYNAGDLTRSLEYYQMVASNKPTAEELQESLVAIEEIMVNDMVNAEGYLDYVESLPDMKFSSFEKDSITYSTADIQYKNGKYENAINAFDKYLTNFPKGFYQLDARYFRAESFLITKKYTRALKDYEFLIGEGFSTFYFQSVKKASLLSYNHVQDFGKAYKYFKLYSEISENDMDKYEANLGAMQSAFRISKEEGLYDHASYVIGSKLASQDDISTAYYYQGKVAYTNENYDLALSSFDYLDKNLNNNISAEGRYLTARIHFIMKDYVAAEEQCNHVNKTCAGYPFWIAKSLLLLSDINLLNKDFLNARAALEAVIENFVENPDIIAEAETKLEALERMEEKESRIKNTINDDQLELDTIDNE